LASFHYKAYTERGAVTAGTIVAEGLDAAIDARWRVAAVTPEQVVLEGQGEKLTVPLHASGR